jgi:hypothetical protein
VLGLKSGWRPATARAIDASNAKSPAVMVYDECEWVVKVDTIRIYQQTQALSNHNHPLAKSCQKTHVFSLATYIGLIMWSWLS